MKKVTFCSMALISGLALTAAQAEINRVRVVNDTNQPIYIHPAGLAPSVKIPPGKWELFPYPFQTKEPGSQQAVQSSKLIATSGGKWMTTQNGFTYLYNPTLMLCLDYKSPEHSYKSGNRVWTIKSAQGRDEGCEIKGYKQTWYKPQTPNTPNVP